VAGVHGKRGSDDAAGVGDEVGYEGDAAACEDVLRGGPDRQVRALDDHLEAKRLGAFGVDDVLDRRGHEDVSVDVELAAGIESLRA
jgi:hypothetical protein